MGLKRTLSNLCKGYYEVMIFPQLENLGEAEKIFKKYNGLKIKETKVKRDFIGDVSVFEENAEDADKMKLVYVVEKNNLNYLLMELVDNYVSGYNQHNKFYTRPLSFFKKLFLEKLVSG